MNLKGLLQKENQDFIRESYRQLLNREVSIAELSIYSHKLAQGSSKIDIIKSLINSQEAIRLYQQPIRAMGPHFTIANIIRTFFTAENVSFVRSAHKEVMGLDMQSVNKNISLTVGFPRTSFIANLIGSNDQLRRLNQKINVPNNQIPRPMFPPKESYSTVWQWVNQSNMFQNMRTIYTEEIIQGPKPKNINQYRELDDSIKKSPPSFVISIPDGIFLGENGGAVITHTGQVLKDISHEMHGMFGNFPKPKMNTSVPGNTMGNVAVLHSFFASNYFHWMFDVASRIELLRKSAFPIDNFILNSSLPFQEEVLGLLGIPKEKRIETNIHLHLKASQLVVPSFTGVINGLVPKWACDFLRKELMLNRTIEKLDGYERIYINRTDAKHRKVVNEDEVMNVLAAYGFKSISLESFSVTEKIQIFQSANTIVAPHGAGLTNLIFCNPGTKVVEIFNPNWMLPCYLTVCNHYGFDYFYLIGQGQRFPNKIDFGKIFENIYVNVNELKSTLELALIKPLA